MFRLFTKLSHAVQVLKGGVSCVPATNFPLLSNILINNKTIIRYTSFFNKLPADHLWKGVTSVSNAGRKRGRGRGAAKKGGRDLNKGQIIGFGKANILWPGLNVPVMRGRELVQQQKLPEDKEREQKLIKLRDSMGTFRSMKILPTERGWSGNKLPGRSIGPPDPIGEDKFEGFDTKCLEFKTVFCMKGNLGRRRRYSCTVISGNQKGLAGFATAKSMDNKGSIRKAKNRAGQRLMYLERYNEHTVLHDFFTQFGATKIYVKKVPEGYGLVCHRAIRTICEVIGIKDIYAKIEGSTSVLHILKAFFLGLLRQKTHQKLADEKKLHLVEFREEKDNFPVVVASPSECRKKDEVPSDEIIDFTQYVMDGKIVLKKKKYPKFYTQLPSWDNHLKKTQFKRNHPEVRKQLVLEYGALRSFLSAKYPEARNIPYWRNKNEAEEQ